MFLPGSSLGARSTTEEPLRGVGVTYLAQPVRHVLSLGARESAGVDELAEGGDEGRAEGGAVHEAAVQQGV